MIVTASNLSDLGRLQLGLEENAARERIAQAQAQQAAQERNQQRFFQQQQAAQQDSFNRAQLAQQGEIARAGNANSDFFNRGRLTNETARIAADLELAKANNAAQQAWREQQLQPKLDAAKADKTAQEQQAAMLASQVDNLAKARNEHDRLTADMAKLNALETVQTQESKLPEAPGTTSRFFRGAGGIGFGASALSAARGLGINIDPFGADKTEGFKPSMTKGDGTKIEPMDYGPVKKRMQQRLDSLTQVLKGNAELHSLLTKAPDGSWVSTVPAIISGTNAPARFFNGTNTVTNAVPVVQPSAARPAQPQVDYPTAINPKTGERVVFRNGAWIPI